jgi:hypothetical protein
VAAQSLHLLHARYSDRFSACALTPRHTTPIYACSCSAAAKRESKASSSKSKLKLDPDSKAPAGFDSGAGDDWDGEEAAPRFDYSQYYPGTLPLQLHHPEDDAGQPELQALLMRQGVPQDLVLRQVRGAAALTAALQSSCVRLASVLYMCRDCCC